MVQRIQRGNGRDDSEHASGIFASGSGDADAPAESRPGGGGNGTAARSLRDAFRDARDTITGDAGTAAINTARERKPRKRRGDSATVAAWGPLLTEGIGAWAAVMEAKNGAHWARLREKSPEIGTAYARLIDFYMPNMAGETSLWGAALIATGSGFGPPLVIDLSRKWESAKQQAAAAGAPNVTPFPFRRPAPQPPPPQPPPPQSFPWTPREPDIVWSSENEAAARAQYNPYAQTAQPEYIPPVPPDIGAAVDAPPDNGLRDIGRMMGLTDAQIEMAMGIVGNMTAAMENEETPPSE